MKNHFQMNFACFFHRVLKAIKANMVLALYLRFERRLLRFARPHSNMITKYVYRNPVILNKWSSALIQAFESDMLHIAHICIMNTRYTICPITIKKHHFQLTHVLPPLQFATTAAAAATLDVRGCCYLSATTTISRLGFSQLLRLESSYPRLCPSPLIHHSPR